MHIPRSWAKATADGRTPDARVLPISVWGWGDDDATAKKTAAERLQRVLDRLRRGEPFPQRYTYGTRPLREEILQVIGGQGQGEPPAIITRNSYGAQVLNTRRLLFLDVDLAPRGPFESLLRWFGRPTPEDAALTRLRKTLQQFGRATFRIYRTRSGFRVLAVNREFDPAAREVQELMQATGTDPAFARLCLAQRSFRARLTPKPWRCEAPLPPGAYPRAEDMRRRFDHWLGEYERASARYATCRYVETIGSAGARGAEQQIVNAHDRTTRCDEALPLA